MFPGIRSAIDDSSSTILDASRQLDQLDASNSTERGLGDLDEMMPVGYAPSRQGNAKFHGILQSLFIKQHVAVGVTLLLVFHIWITSIQSNCELVVILLVDIRYSIIFQLTATLCLLMSCGVIGAFESRNRVRSHRDVPFVYLHIMRSIAKFLVLATFAGAVIGIVSDAMIIITSKLLTNRFSHYGSVLDEGQSV